MLVDRFAVDMLHHEVGRTVGGEAGVVELGDVGVHELGEDLLFAQQPVEIGGSLFELDDLDRDAAFEQSVGAFAEVDPTHPSFADRGDDAVSAELAARRQGAILPTRRLAEQVVDEVGAQRAARAEERVLLERRGEQRGELGPALRALDPRESERSLLGGQTQQLGEVGIEGGGAGSAGNRRPRRVVAQDGSPRAAAGIRPSSCLSQARARSQSRRTVRSDTSRATAVSSSVIPA